MCCSVSPNVEVSFSDTIIYAAEVVNLQNKPVHVLGYQNRAQNNVQGSYFSTNLTLERRGFWDKFKDTFIPQSKKHSHEITGNAMILHFPCVLRTMTKANVLDTKNCPDILKDMADALVPPVVAQSYISGEFMMPRSAAVEVFEAAGIYTVVLAQDARDIPQALNQVPKEKRPKLNPELFEAYAKWYPNWTFALCCFNNEEAKDALPMLWWYEPSNPDKLFIPALDCHTGNVPTLNTSVLVDHSLAAGSIFVEDNLQSKKTERNCPQCSKPNPNDNGFCLFCGSVLPTLEINWQANYQNVAYKNPISNELKPYLLPKVIGGIYSEIMPNGDFVCQIEDVRKGIWNPVRTLPPNA